MILCLLHFAQGPDGNVLSIARDTVASLWFPQIDSGGSLAGCKQRISKDCGWDEWLHPAETELEDQRGGAHTRTIFYLMD
jgi:hypothetical protein